MPTNLNGFVVFGAIEEKWLAMGAGGSALGVPTSNEAPTFDGVGRGQSFQNGFMSWHPEIGAFAVYGLIGVRWNELGREAFGYPITDELGTPNGVGRFNHFRGMQHPGRPETSIYWTAETGAHEVFGAIRDKWASMGWETSPLGFPRNGEEATFDGVGRFQLFQGGVVSWHPELGAHVIWGLISARWWELGREQYGYPITDELPTPNGVGRFNHFKAMHLDGRPENSIYWTAETGAHEVFGAIRDKWASMGWETSPLGFPRNGEEATFDGVGRFQLFQGGVVSWHPELGAHVIWGLISARWWELGREQYGYPITDELPTPNGVGRFNHFKAMHLDGRPENSIYWTAETGAHEVFGAIRDKWASMEWETSPLGFPRNGEEATFDGVGRFQLFQGGVVSWHPELGAHVIWGLISARWWELGREQYGYPITDELPTPNGVGRFNHFKAMHLDGRPENSIYWTAETGAHEVFGAIRDKWASMGWETSPLGFPRNGEEATFDGVGRFQLFQGGVVSWHPELGAHAIWGLISARWWELGREQYGYPITDERPTPDGVGRFNHLKAMHLGGRREKSIYWHPDTGAHEIYGAIRGEWAGLGWETSPLGYPTGGERDRPGGGRIEDFQFGAIAWTPARGAWVDWVRMRRGITTPQGTALGGWAELELHADGKYHFRGHMHDSGFDSYEFRVRAALASTAGVAIVAQKTGDVEGTSSGFSPRRDFDWDDTGFSALMAAEWHDIDLRTFGVAKSYEDTGVLGGLESVAVDVLSFLIMDVALGPSAALIILIGNELSEISGGSVFGVGGIPGVLVTAGASFLIGPAMAIPIFVGTAVVTNALVKHRKLSQEEYDFANVVYQGTLPPIDRITMTNLSGIGGRAFVAPNADGTVLMNISDEVYSSPGGPIVATHGNKYPLPGQVLIHELAHAWQLQRNGFVPGYVCAGATSSNYEPPPPGSSWSSDFNIEQQATTVDQWFQRHAMGWNTMPGNRVENLRTLLSSAAAMRDDYFPYISNHIRMAQN